MQFIRKFINYFGNNHLHKPFKIFSSKENYKWVVKIIFLPKKKKKKKKKTILSLVTMNIKTINYEIFHRVVKNRSFS
jgi:hypothetical protein